MAFTFAVSKKATLTFDIGEADEVKISSFPTKWEVSITNGTSYFRKRSVANSKATPTKDVDLDILTSLLILNDAMASLDAPITVIPVHRLTGNCRELVSKTKNADSRVFRRRKSSGAAAEEVEFEINKMKAAAKTEETKPFKRFLWLRTPFRKTKKAVPDDISMVCYPFPQSRTISFSEVIHCHLLSP
uniref:Uncharacterized protein n=1 Tax=Caenorhabditis tropicalis TaxID=1561998 RepID=A0A1I7UF33_9PELO